jgi:hypothetical protein
MLHPESVIIGAAVEGKSTEGNITLGPYSEEYSLPKATLMLRQKRFRLNYRKNFLPQVLPLALITHPFPNTTITAGNKACRANSLFFLIIFSPNIIIIFWVKFFCTLGTDTMAECRLGMFTDIDFNLVPISLVVTYFFAGRTYWKHPA